MTRFLAAVVLVPLLAAPALAQDKAGAEAAFREGRRLMDEGNHAEACKQFQLSNELDPAIGTLLNLADCHEKIGKTASAWAEFTETADKASRAGQGEREQEARKRATALEPRLVRLQIKVEADAPAGLAVTRNGADVTRTTGTALPVDPGSYEIQASAPGYEPWTNTIEVQGDGQTVTVSVPALEKAASAGGTTTGGTTGGDLTGAATLDTSKRRTRRIFAASTAGVGVVAMGVGLVFGAKASSKNSDSEDHCDEDNVCDDIGFDLVKDAQSNATLANVFVGVGVAAVAAGAVLWFTAPDPERVPAASFAPTLTPDQIGITFGGRF